MQQRIINILFGVVIVILTGVVVYLTFGNKSTPVTDIAPAPAKTTVKTPVPPTQATSAKHIVLFEEAINKSDFSNASKYFADKVNVLLEGSSCCGVVNASRAEQELGRIRTGIVFTFNPNDVAVKEYIASQYIDYPNRRLINNSPKLYFDELSIGVDSDASQQNKTSIGYKVSNDKITDLFINPTSESVTSDWKTYINTSLGFSIKYPPNWKIDSLRSDRTKSGNDVVFEIGIPESDERVSVDVSNLTLDEWANQWATPAAKTVVEGTYHLTIDGQSAIRIDTTEFGRKLIGVKVNGKLYIFTTGGRMIDNGMLSTVKFMVTE